MSARDDGGPAFPMPYSTDEHHSPCNSTLANPGMYLRDYFAAHVSTESYKFKDIAKASELLGVAVPETDAELLHFAAKLDAHIRYSIADAMLEARK